ncbi:hypothetical protein, partial [Acinetobacter baumannii]|uniref:hypothetical protein n=1 Tax=Acinetobacter baumannii TaxID=470 RepID=UPI0028A27917
VVEGQVLAAVTNTLASASNQTIWSPDMAGSRLTDIKFSRTFGQDGTTSLYMIDNEQVVVSVVGDRDSAGTGLTLIT